MPFFVFTKTNGVNGLTIIIIHVSTCEWVSTQLVSVTVKGP